MCWIHAERIINRLIPLNAEHIKAVDDTREQLWQLYRDLKTYKLEPTAIQAEDIKSGFIAMCSAKTAYVTLNLALKRMGNNQHELLRVLDKPYLPPVRPQGQLINRVKVPVGVCHNVVAESNCVIVKWGGEQLEAKRQSAG